MRLGPTAFSLVAATWLACAAGCGRTADAEVVAEGVIYSVEYQTEQGRTTGFTRLNIAKSVPGGNGSWNVDAYGKLSRDFLVVTRPQQHDLGPQVIPVSRLIDVQFGDGGIKSVDEVHPAPPQ